MCEKRVRRSPSVDGNEDIAAAIKVRRFLQHNIFQLASTLPLSHGVCFSCFSTNAKTKNRFRLFFDNNFCSLSLLALRWMVFLLKSVN
jgi:hypothetical protein